MLFPGTPVNLMGYGAEGLTPCRADFPQDLLSELQNYIRKNAGVCSLVTP